MLSSSGPVTTKPGYDTVKSARVLPAFAAPRSKAGRLTSRR